MLNTQTSHPFLLFAADGLAVIWVGSYLQTETQSDPLRLLLLCFREDSEAQRGPWTCPRAHSSGHP